MSGWEEVRNWLAVFRGMLRDPMGRDKDVWDATRIVLDALEKELRDESADD